MTPPDSILELAERFERNRVAYRSGYYNETQVRREFIDPFFEALGWDVANRQGYAEAYKDVVHEETLKVGGGTKAPDYGFRIGGARKFFVEAKKPSVDIKGDVHPAYQLRRYAWSAKLSLSVLTDFEEFAAYDCRVRPDKGDKASTARVLYVPFDQYAQRWDEIAGVFSREAILRGSFDKYAEGTASKRGTAEVDRAFLAEIERWRDLLARSIALRNPGLTQRQLNFAVQQTIDRIIFLRICEDRGIEPYGALLGLTNGAQVYERLLLRFRHADARYNSGLFHFEPDRTRVDAPDTLTTRIAIDDRPLRDILKNLYYPDSPYEFSVLPADILGQVYEQFLGKVIRLQPYGAGQRAVVEEKPEVRKAGGVFYTPTFIVDAIVRETLGRLAASAKLPTFRKSWQLSPSTNGRTPLRVADIACGSGSFLLGAYQFLLDWHLAAYVADDARAKQWAAGREPRIYQTGRGDWRLTIPERKRILLDHIYGVDIDPQAVEVTKLSLLLKVLEGEDEQTMGQQLALFPERALPDLAHNIKCGNSLIGPHFYEGQQLALLDDAAMERVNVFDWRAEFPQVFADGGFDVIIGNPPYVRPHNLEPEIKEYFWKHYPTFVKKSDLYNCFLEKGLKLLRAGGLLGYIVSNGWLRLDSFEELRRFLLSHSRVIRIVDFTGDVFVRANVKTALVFLERSQDSDDHVVETAMASPTTDLNSLIFRQIPQRAFHKTYKYIFDLSIESVGEGLKSKMKERSEALAGNFELSFGLKSGDDSRFLTHNPTSDQHKRLLRGANVQRYAVNFAGEYVWYVPEQMVAHRKTARPGNAARFEQPKVLIRDTGGSLFGTYDAEDYYVKDMIIISHFAKNGNFLKYLIGILNSRLMGYYYESSFPTLHVQRDELASLPIRTIDFTDPADVARHDRMVGLVERMLDLHKRAAVEPVPHLKTLLQRQIEATDRQIDALVYELYGLTDEEVRIVEEGG